jgi:hypothetical protein
MAGDAAADLPIGMKHGIAYSPRVDPMIVERVVQTVHQLAARPRSHCPASHAVGNDEQRRRSI